MVSVGVNVGTRLSEQPASSLLNLVSILPGCPSDAKRLPDIRLLLSEYYVFQVSTRQCARPYMARQRVKLLTGPRETPDFIPPTSQLWRPNNSDGNKTKMLRPRPRRQDQLSNSKNA